MENSKFEPMSSPSLFEISSLSCLAPLVVSIFRWSNYRNSHKIVVLYLLTSLIIDVIGFGLKKMGYSNVILGNCFILMQLLLIGKFFEHCFKNDGTTRNIFKWLHLAAITGVFITFVTVSDFVVKLNTNALILSSFAILVYCMFGLTRWVQLGFVRELFSVSEFIILTAIFIYTSTVLTIYCTFHHFEISVLEQLWRIKLSGYIVFNLVIAYAFLVQNKLE